MNEYIYRIENDFSFIDLTFLNKEDIRLFSAFKGQQITLDWNEEIFAISEDKHTRGKLLDFDSRCYGGTLIIKKKFEKLFIEEFSNQLETLPIKIKGILEEYVYVNVTNVVPAIDFEGLDMQESLAMLRSNHIKFNLEEIEHHVLFRDAKISLNYFCTQSFIDFIEKNEMNGLHFTQVGIAGEN